jgi:hypothetical protein
MKIVRQLEQVFEPHRMMFGELKGINKVAHIKMLLQSNEKTLKNCNFFPGGGGGELLGGFCFPQVVLKPKLGEMPEMTIMIMHFGLCNCRVKFPECQTSL